MTTLAVKTKRTGPVLGRHPWLFSQALVQIPEKLESGEPVKLIDENGTFLALGYFNSYSQIAVRIWSYEEDESIDETFFTNRIKKAKSIRESYLNKKETNAYRLINSENDFLPGLIVDKYADYLVLQCHTKGIERWKQPIIDALVKLLKPAGIYERSDASHRQVENAEKQTGLLYGDIPDLIEIKENGLKFLVDVKTGQKTGFFLDQRDKRNALIKYCKDKKVLNCCSYTGGFSVYALQGGATKVTSVDVSQSALDLAKKNVELNDFNTAKCEFICEDVKKFLRETTEKFDVIVLDPPAFIKDRHKIKEGLSGYKYINEAALRLLPPGGILVTCSCSAHLSLQDFRFMITESAAKAKRSTQILETFTHGLDHPELTAFTEGEYLKCYILIAS